MNVIENRNELVESYIKLIENDNLENLIKESDKVMIMGHTNPDIDAMGSSMGIYRLAKSMNKNAYIINSTIGTALENFKE